MTALRNVWALVEKEWRHYFGSPIAYVAICMWTLLFGAFYVLVINRFMMVSLRAGQSEMGGGPKLSLNDWVISGVMHNMAVVALFITPMLTMRLFAEEKRQGTMELLSTSPITDLQIVMGKFLAAVGVYALMIVAGLLDLVLLWHYGAVNPEWKPALTGALALLLAGASFMALGLFVSTLTRNQIVAATVTFGLALLMWTLSWMDNPTSGVVTRALAYMGVTNHMEEMAKGVLAAKDLVFYFSVIAFGLFLTHQSVQSQRWRA